MSQLNSSVAQAMEHAYITHDILPTPSSNDSLPLIRGDFATLAETLDYAARGQTGLNFYDAKGNLALSLTYFELRDKSRIMAQHLIGLGLERGDRVGVIASMSPEFVIAFFACQYAGMLSVPLPVVTGLGGRTGYQAQLKRVLSSSGAKIALGLTEHLEDLHQATEGLSLHLVGLNDDVLKAPSAHEAMLNPLDASEDSHIQYSSGSTRNPMGVCISQNALMANAQSVAKHGLQMRAGDRCASWLPFYHDMGLIGFFLIPITCQMSIDLLNTDSFARRPMLWLEIISRNRCTLSFSPTFGYEVCSRRAAKRTGMNLDLSCWRVAGIGGEMVQPEIMQDFVATFADFGFKAEAFVPSYGLAEITLAFSFTPLDKGVFIDTIDKNALIEQGIASPASQDADKSSTRQFAGCGLPLPGYAMQIMDESGKSLPERHVGGVYIKGPSLMNGYYGQEHDESERPIDEEGWLKTGDMGYISEGQLVITGRQKDLIIINGRNIWPQDIEWYAESQIEELRTRDTAAFAVEDSHGKEHAVLLVHCRLTDPKARNNLRHNIHAAIYRNNGIDCKIVMIPAGSLPFTTSGKLSRAKAKQAYIKGELCEMETA